MRSIIFVLLAVSSVAYADGIDTSALTNLTNSWWPTQSQQPQPTPQPDTEQTCTVRYVRNTLTGEIYAVRCQ